MVRGLLRGGCRGGVARGLWERMISFDERTAAPYNLERDINLLVDGVQNVARWCWCQQHSGTCWSSPHIQQPCLSLDFCQPAPKQPNVSHVPASNCQLPNISHSLPVNCGAGPGDPLFQGPIPNTQVAGQTDSTCAPSVKKWTHTEKTECVLQASAKVALILRFRWYWAYAAAGSVHEKPP